MPGEPNQKPVSTSPKSRDQLELEYLSQQVEKMKLEIAELKSTSPLDRILSRYLPVVASSIAVVGFLFGVYQYQHEQLAAENQRSESLRREVARGFFESQLKLYLAASQAAATIATSSNESARDDAKAQFWELYYGPLACVEDIGIDYGTNDPDKKEDPRTAAVERAMVKYGNLLEENPDIGDPRMKRLSLDLAQAIRNIVGPSFKLPTPETMDERNEKKPK